MATTRAAILARAASQIGKTEYPAGTNINEFGEWYGMNRVPWCDIFISWVFAKEGAGYLIGGKFAYCPWHLEWFKKNNRSPITPAAGDIVFFKFPGMSVTGHVGIIEKVLPNGDLQTIEGNTSSGNYGSQDNGGGVYRRFRTRTYVAGYGRPAYTAPPAPAPKPAVTTKPQISSADRQRVVLLQKALHVVADGQFGTGTITALNAVLQRDLSNVKFLQKVVGTTPDGVWGPASEAARITTIKAVQRVISVTPDGVWGPATKKAWASFFVRTYMKF